MKTLTAIPGISSLYSKQILGLFSALPQGTSVILFGSRAKGNYREGSDVDLALRGAEVSFEDRDRLLQEYENLNLPWKLDVVLYDRLENLELKEHIDRVGCLLASRDSS
ncbi:nucleotidyltransferase domain-containing protein [Bdellovibrionota bacterium FG-1]